MTPEQIHQLIAVGSILISGGLASIAQFQAVLQLLRREMSEAELNEVLAAVRDDAKRRAVMAQLDAARARADAGTLGG